MEHRIQVTMTDGVADVRIDRTDKMNAIDADMFWALAEIGEQLRSDRSLRAVVLSGNGRAFCAGLDFEGIGALAKGQGFLPFTDLTRRSHGIANWAQHVVWLWRELPVPVIAAVHGVAFGGGFQLALGADIRYAAPDTKFSVMETKWGIVPDMAGTQLMRHLAREDIVRELTYTARLFSAEEALAYGFVTRVVADPREAALASAREIAGRSPDAIRAAKRLLNLAATCDAATGLLAETDEQMRLMGTPNQVEAVAAGREKRPPRFVDPA
ncbi:MAG TPA: crotonase/enoyl-CoA hydratase family protein [Burkholderiaceae bacterium]